MVGRKQKPLDATTKNYTKEEIEAKKNKEVALESFETLSKTPPRHLTDLAKAEYKKIYQLIQQLPVAQLDQQTLVMYCELYSDYREITVELEQLKQMNSLQYDLAIDKQINSKRRQRLEIFREIRSIGNLLGMNMDSRMRLVPSES